MKKLVPLLFLAATAFTAERFDYLVRADFFAGLAGDQAAFSRAMKTCEDALAKNPQHAEALVWHGSGQLVLAGQLFRKGEMQQGGQLWARGLKEMEMAGTIAPENNGVLIPRGATLPEASRSVPDPEQSKALTAKGVADYEKVWEKQKPVFDNLSGHSRGELLFGLADGYDRLGRKEEAKAVFQALAAVGTASGHSEEAAEYLDKGSYTRKAVMCTGCHTSK